MNAELYVIIHVCVYVCLDICFADIERTIFNCNMCHLQTTCYRMSIRLDVNYFKIMCF